MDPSLHNIPSKDSQDVTFERCPLCSRPLHRCASFEFPSCKHTLCRNCTRRQLRIPNQQQHNLHIQCPVCHLKQELFDCLVAAESDTVLYKALTTFLLQNIKKDSSSDETVKSSFLGNDGIPAPSQQTLTSVHEEEYPVSEHRDKSSTVHMLQSSPSTWRESSYSFTECPGCLTGVRSGNNCVLPVCGHVFCDPCIQRYVLATKEERRELKITCTLCRATMDRWASRTHDASGNGQQLVTRSSNRKFSSWENQSLADADQHSPVRLSHFATACQEGFDYSRQLQIRQEFEECEIKCPVCWESRKASESFVSPVCGHAFCQDCLKRRIEILRRDKEEHSIPCLQCNASMDPSLCLKVVGLNPEVKEFLEQVGIKQMMRGSLRYCANPRCAEPFEWLGNSTDCSIRQKYKVTCPICTWSTCARCRRVWHSNLTCKEGESELATLHLATRRGWSSCPNCGCLIEKVGGCGNMTCRCGHPFSYYHNTVRRPVPRPRRRKAGIQTTHYYRAPAHNDTYSGQRLAPSTKQHVDARTRSGPITWLSRLVGFNHSRS